MELNNRVVIITGASSGIGEATARAALQAGARVAMLARRRERREALAVPATRALAIACDLTQSEACARAVQQVIASWGRVDVVINNAGQGLYAPVEAIDVSDFREVLALNLIAPLQMMQAVVPVMRQQGGGSIVNVSSGATLGTYSGSAAYTSAKAALNMLSAVARLELASAGISVSLLYPFVTATAFYHSVKAGQAGACAQAAESAALLHAPALVAEAILDLVRSGAAEADLVPVAFGGSWQPENECR